MLKDNVILLGKSNETEVHLLPQMLNRHGFIAGASGTGKTVTLKVIAESLSQLGVPTIIADVKGDLSGMIQQGDMSQIEGRLEKLGIDNFQTMRFPVSFYDVYRKNGHPVRIIIEEFEPELFARILGLTDAQTGNLQIIYKVAQDMNLDLIDLKDLQAMANYVGMHASEISLQYGNVTKQSIGGIQRKLLQLEHQGGSVLFGMPAISTQDFFRTSNGLGVMNMLECKELFQYPLLYATFMLWLLNQLYIELPEVGDLDKPKLVFFFDEAHLLFNDLPKTLLTKIEQIVKLIRSKGVGVFFITQSPNDIPSSILAQLSNRIQHALRAYTPTEIKAVKLAADSFRQNPNLDTAERITNMKTGVALVSVLDSEGAPTIVEETTILPPASSMNQADPTLIQQEIRSDVLYETYEKDIDPESAYEKIGEMKEENPKQTSKKKETDWSDRFTRKIRNRAENEIVNIGIRSAKKFLKNFFG
ncbi:MAG: DUF853 domain-containing protein [Erysipelotrichaceae bacterium]|nr:DUF853 domain-containing protein [Erysipelotrichaceae bacterium]